MPHFTQTKAGYQVLIKDRRQVTMTLYEQLKGAGVPLDNHESDLYALANETSKQIIMSHRNWQNTTTFRSQIDGKIWYDIPFAYQPFWEHVQKLAMKKSGQ